MAKQTTEVQVLVLRRVYRCPKCGALKQVSEGWEMGKYVCDECGTLMKVMYQTPSIHIKE